MDEATLQNNPKLLSDQVQNLINDEGHRKTLSENIGRLARPEAAKSLAKIILETASSHA